MFLPVPTNTVHRYNNNVLPTVMREPAISALLQRVHCCELEVMATTCGTYVCSHVHGCVAAMVQGYYIHKVDTSCAILLHLPRMYRPRSALLKVNGSAMKVGTQTLAQWACRTLNGTACPSILSGPLIVVYRTTIRGQTRCMARMPQIIGLGLHAR